MAVPKSQYELAVPTKTSFFLGWTLTILPSMLLIFSGVMKPGEKAVITFSCVEKKHVPEGTAAIEAEMQVVGFADASEKKADTYWKNTDITPDARKKGGVK